MVYQDSQIRETGTGCGQVAFSKFEGWQPKGGSFFVPEKKSSDLLIPPLHQPPSSQHILKTCTR